MENSRIFLLIFLLLASNIFAQEGSYFKTEIWQHGKKLPINNHTVVLEKKAFDLVLYLDTELLTGVLINVNTNDRAFNAFKEGNTLKAAFVEPGFFGGMAEYDNNLSNDLIIEPNSAHYLYYSDAEQNRFNKTVLDTSNGWVKGIRHVDRFQFYADEFNGFDATKTILIKDAPFSDVYLVYYHYKYGENYKKIELQRYQLHLKFK